MFQSNQSPSLAGGTIKVTESRNDIYNNSEADISGSDFLPIPSREDIYAFIKSQPDYRHSVESIGEHFAKKKVSCADGRAAELWLNSIRGAGNRIREEIETQENGKWKFERRARQKTFRFIKPDAVNTSTLANRQGSLFEQIEDESLKQE